MESGRGAHRGDSRERTRRSRSPDQRSARQRLRSRSPHQDRRRGETSRHNTHEDSSILAKKTRSRSRSRSRDRQPPPRRRPRSRSHSQDSPRRTRKRSHSQSRSRTRSRSPGRKQRRRRSRSASSSSSSSDQEERKRRKKEKKEKKQAKKDKKERKKQKTAASSGAKWGKYGIISETDIFTKSDEFYAWLVEERLLNPETLPKDQNRKEFARFVEDYNTATLPHPKFYALATYESRMSALRAGETLPPIDDGYDPNRDLRELEGRKRKNKKDTVDDSILNREQLEVLRKVQQERFQVGKMRALGMDVAPSMGVRMDGTSFE